MSACCACRDMVTYMLSVHDYDIWNISKFSKATLAETLLKHDVLNKFLYSFYGGTLFLHLNYYYYKTVKYLFVSVNKSSIVVR